MGKNDNWKIASDLISKSTWGTSKTKSFTGN